MQRSGRLIYKLLNLRVLVPILLQIATIAFALLARLSLPMLLFSLVILASLAWVLLVVMFLAMLLSLIPKFVRIVTSVLEAMSQAPALLLVRSTCMGGRLEVTSKEVMLIFFLILALLLLMCGGAARTLPCWMRTPWLLVHWLVVMLVLMVLRARSSIRLKLDQALAPNPICFRVLFIPSRMETRKLSSSGSVVMWKFQSPWKAFYCILQ